MSTLQRWSNLFAWSAVLVACGNDAGAGPTSTGQAGTGGAATTAGSAGTSPDGGGNASGGTATAGAGATSGGDGGAGGIATSRAGSGGTPAGGTATSGTSGAGGSGGGAGGAGKCAANALSLSANGSGTDSDAAQARLVIDLGADTPTGNANRTIEFWMYVKPTDWVGERNQIFYSGGAGTNTTFGLDFGTNPVAGMPNNHATLDPFTNGSLSVDSTADLGINSASAQWLHVAMTWDGGALKAYVNGTLRITSTVNASLATASGPLIVGCNPGNSYCFSGLFSELRVWSVARSEAELKATYSKSLVGNETGLVGYFKLDEAPGTTTAADSTTTANHVAHPGLLMADTPAHQPTFVTPTPAAPLVCTP